MTDLITFSTIGDPEKHRYIRLQIVGKLTEDCFSTFIPFLERIVRSDGKVRLMIDLSQFEGWTADGSWEDMLFGFKFHIYVDRIAIVGDRKWNLFLTDLVEAFAKSSVRRFDLGYENEADEWLLSEESSRVEAEQGFYEAMDLSLKS